MQILLNTDSNIEGTEHLAARVNDVVGEALRDFAEQITRVEVHLSDVNGPKEGAMDKRCMLEARLAGRQPTSVTRHASSAEQAIAGAAEDLTKVLERALR